MPGLCRQASVLDPSDSILAGTTQVAASMFYQRVSQTFRVKLSVRLLLIPTQRASSQISSQCDFEVMYTSQSGLDSLS